MNIYNGSITDVPGILVGHEQNSDALTGCTVILCADGAVGGVDQRGGSPGTRETDLLRPMHMVEKIHAVVLAGGSAFGLDAAGGVMRWCEANGIGFDTGYARVPIVPGAILFDLGIGDPQVRPDAEMGYRACVNACADALQQGNWGAGMGATVGKALGMSMATKAGIGTASVRLGELVIGAIIAVNAFGEVIDPQNGAIIAGARNDPSVGGYLKIMDLLGAHAGMMSQAAESSNTVIGVIATNARLTKEEVNKVAQMAQDGLAQTIRPAHTPYDGDTLFAMATGMVAADVMTVGAFAAQVTAQAILNGVRSAQAAGGVLAWDSANTNGQD